MALCRNLLSYPNCGNRRDSRRRIQRRYDAKPSYAPREKKLEIMSDPHVGSFAVIFTVLYFILQFGLFTEIDGVRAAIIPACGFVLSRTLSGFAAVTFKCAKKDGNTPELR